MKPIVPIDEPLFRLPVLHEAAHLAHADPAALTDLHLAHVAVYSEADATAYAIKRDRAIEAAERAVAMYRTKAEAPLATVPPPPVSTGITAEGLDALVDGLTEGLKKALAPMRTQIAALETANAKLADRVLELEAQRAAVEGKP